MLPDNTGDDELGTQQIRACVRGRSIRHRIYNPDRLKTPDAPQAGLQRRGRVDEITWEDAFDEIAATIQRLIKDYGNESIYINYGTGTLGGTIACSWPPNASPFARLMNCAGGYLNHYGDYSAANIEQAAPFTFGSWVSSNSFDDAPLASKRGSASRRSRARAAGGRRACWPGDGRSAWRA
ncbi:molybdopterin-dependent oxidoreductase [Georgenia sp. SUBG003]|uniref:molybdopterin-dependent oxidoreductase n=1 Tax=Georgenia sp. SUBG003 TaxID=1497974 RepID=UPI003AB575D0